MPLFQWPTPDGFPDHTAAWSGALLARWKFALALAALYAGGAEQIGESSLSIVGRETLDVLAIIEALDPAAYRPSRGVIYPETEFGVGLRQVAMLIKAEVGLEVACLDLGGWDTHVAQGGSEGAMASLLADLGAGLAALYADLRDHADKLLVVTMSEFGQRVQENGGLGTNHGHGSMMMLIGGGVAGGRVHGQWPGLAPERLVGPGDLAVTTDYRDVLGELLHKRLNNSNLEAVFPGYRPMFRGVAHNYQNRLSSRSNS